MIGEEKLPLLYATLQGLEQACIVAPVETGVSLFVKAVMLEAMLG